jgi:hypothetical protein
MFVEYLRKLCLNIFCNICYSTHLCIIIHFGPKVLFITSPRSSCNRAFLMQEVNSTPTPTHNQKLPSDSVIPYLDVLVIRKEMALATKVYRKPTYTGRYHNFKSNVPPCVKRYLICSLHNRPAICQE